MSPAKLALRVYNVGFGDCLLLSFEYARFTRRILIDFGTSSAPRNAGPDFMMKIAHDIRGQCRGKLDAVVATHRHRDHISGFATNGRGTGRIIAGLAPDIVVQPWTEDPAAKPDAKAPTAVLRNAFLASLGNMHAVAAAAAREAQDPRNRMGKRLREQIAFLGDDNLENRSAIDNLMAMGRKTAAAYVHCGSKSGLERLLPGVEVHVLGPPTLEQTETIRGERQRDPEEFWQFHNFWLSQSLGSSRRGKPLFPKAPVWAERQMPPNVRWFVSRAGRVRSSQLLELVRALDKAMNNTSVILLFRVGKFALLFPGDAQIENWAYALGQERYRQMLAEVNLYKVGHHGSLNATPKSLWKLFQNRRAEESAGRLQSVVSTKSGKHGSAQAHTEVPRATLVEALKRETDYFSTQSLKKAEIAREFEFPI